MTRRELTIDASALFALKIVVSLAVLLLGFTHVSDDDYSRIVIAQLFAHAPKLDPSGTSWLPFPFWVTGSAMLVFGRSLVVARVVAVLMASLATTAPYLGARALGVPRVPALLGAIIASSTPWCAWLGVATVPEGFSGLVTAGSVLAIASNHRRAWLFGAVGLLLASLSRYESWPACALCVAILLWHRSPLALVCAAGPLGWMAWNAHAHGSAFHFFSRVSTFRELHAPAPLSERLFGNPLALVTAFPEAVLIGIAGAIAGRERKWVLPLGCAALTLVMLIVSDVRGGAPTHHPERALVPVAALLIVFGVSATKLPRGITATLSCTWLLATLFRIGGYPNDDRSTQIARGKSLRGEPSLDVVPCAYEHFALIAAYGAPENVTIRPPAASAMAECPSIAPRSK